MQILNGDTLDPVSQQTTASWSVSRCLNTPHMQSFFPEVISDLVRLCMRAEELTVTDKL